MVEIMPDFVTDDSLGKQQEMLPGLRGTHRRFDCRSSHVLLTTTEMVHDREIDWGDLTRA